MSLLRLPHVVFLELRAHAEEAFPGECCGALLGRPAADGWHIESLIRATNAHKNSHRDRYEIAPAELVKIAQQARHRGLEIAGFYHSHPGHPAHWSAADLEQAHWLGCVYVITEVIAGKATATNAFLLAGAAEEEKRFVPATLQFSDAGPATNSA
jgi:proteasome lid subunit RPN8/RPN11